MKKFILLAAVFLASCTVEPKVDPLTIVIDMNSLANKTGVVDYREVECLAKNIYFEARGESLEGQIAIATVAANRVKDPGFPDTFCDVIYQGPVSEWFLMQKSKVVPLLHQCQFAWYCDGKSDNPRDMWAWGRALTISAQVVQGNYDDPTHGAMWYHSTKVNPNWGKLSVVAKINNHIFYR